MDTVFPKAVEVVFNTLVRPGTRSMIEPYLDGDMNAVDPGAVL